LVHVDGVLIVGSKYQVDNVMTFLSKAFELSKCEDVKYFLNVEVKRDRERKSINLISRAIPGQIGYFI
jgi:hypothetical protein